MGLCHHHQAERLKQQASCWEKEERVAFGGRQPLTKVHCRVPYRTYERRAALSWARRIQQHPQEAAASDDDEDADDYSDASDASDGSTTAPTRAHGVLAAKRKVTLYVGKESVHRLSITVSWRNKGPFQCTGSLHH